MARSTIVYDSKLKLPAPLDGISINIGTSNGGATFTVKGVEGIDPADLQTVLGRVRTYLKKVSSERQAAEAKAKEIARQAKEAERQRVEARMAKETEEQERQIRRNSFLKAKGTPLAVPFDAASMFATGNEDHALRVAVNNPQLQFAGYFETQEYINGAGHVTHKNFAFLDPDKLGAQVCPECGRGTLHTSVSQSSGRVHKECRSGACRFFSNELPQVKVRVVFV